MVEKNNYRYTIKAYNEKYYSMIGCFADEVNVILFADDENSAITKSKELITRKYYTIINIEQFNN